MSKYSEIDFLSYLIVGKCPNGKDINHCALRGYRETFRNSTEISEFLYKRDEDSLNQMLKSHKECESQIEGENFKTYK